MSEPTWNTTNNNTNVHFTPGWGWFVAAAQLGVMVGYLLGRYLP